MRTKEYLQSIHHLDTSETTLSKINELEVSDHRTVLTLRYAKGMKWEEIAVSMSLSYRHTLHIHRHALAELEKVL